MIALMSTATLRGRHGRLEPNSTCPCANQSVVVETREARLSSIAALHAQTLWKARDNECTCEGNGHSPGLCRSAPCVARGEPPARLPLFARYGLANVEDRPVCIDSWRRRLDVVVGLEALRCGDALEDPRRCAGSMTTDSQHALLTI